MSVKNLSTYDRMTYRSITFHGKNSMKDMNLMMIGSTPLSEVVPKQVREEVAYADGDLDLSRVDGEIYFEPRTITYTFALIDEHPSGDLTPVGKNKRLTNELTKIYRWLYSEYVDYHIPLADAIAIIGSLAPWANNCYVLKDEMYDYGYGVYKFKKASVTETKVNKAMFNGEWVETIEVTFTCDPYLQTFYGDKIELATFVDRSMTNRSVQTELMIFNNSAYFLNDYYHWFGEGNAVHATGNTWRFRIRIPYTGVIGFHMSPDMWVGDDHFVVTAITGQTTPLYFLDNDHPGETIRTHAGGYGYTTPTTDPNGYKIIDFTVTYQDAPREGVTPPIAISWGVLRNYTVPDQEHYIVDAYSKSNSATMYISHDPPDGEYHPQNFSTAFTLPEVPLNQIHIINNEYDGMYKFRYDTTTRRL